MPTFFQAETKNTLIFFLPNGYKCYIISKTNIEKSY